MKKAINLIIMYFVFLIMGIVFGTLLYTMFSNLLNYVAGSNLQLFSVSSLFKSYLYMSYCMLFLSCPFLAFYRIRHPGGTSQGIAYIILCLVTWLLLLPANYKLTGFIANRFVEESEKTYLSKDYFRQGDNEIFYFTNDFSKSEYGTMQADAVVIHLNNEDSYVDFRPIRDIPSFVLNEKAAPFKEILVSETFLDKSKLSVVDFKILVEEACNSISSGFFYFLFYLSFGLVICSLYSLTNLFDWRLLNSSLLFLLTASVLGFNSGVVSPWLAGISEALSSNPIYKFLADWTSDPLIFVGNCLFTLIILIIWIVTSAIKRHNQKKN
ncbi:MAG: hypothetical protein K5681_02720 [Treponema sp.]|nr:hypothetical protein [Treponema sp.]